MPMIGKFSHEVAHPVPGCVVIDSLILLFEKGILNGQGYPR